VFRNAFIRLVLGGLLLAGLSLILANHPAVFVVHAQQPTGVIPTVTGTLRGPSITVNIDQDFVNVRSGPSSTFYPRIGILMRGQTVPALARSEDGQWIQIRYLGAPGGLGWVFAANVTLSSQALPRAAAPPTPTFAATPTINPTLQAALIPAVTATGLATFTPAPPLAEPSFTDATPQPAAVPLGLVILGLGFVGAVVAMASLLRGR